VEVDHKAEAAAEAARKEQARVYMTKVSLFRHRTAAAPTSPQSVSQRLWFPSLSQSCVMRCVTRCVMRCAASCACTMCAATRVCFAQVEARKRAEAEVEARRLEMVRREQADGDDAMSS